MKRVLITIVLIPVTIIKAITRTVYMKTHRRELLEVKAYVYDKRAIYSNDRTSPVKGLSAIGESRGALDTLETLHLLA